nr:hypothetical protein CFP56_58757 [Quercus suber]
MAIVEGPLCIDVAGLLVVIVSRRDDRTITAGDAGVAVTTVDDVGKMKTAKQPRSRDERVSITFPFLTWSRHAAEAWKEGLQSGSCLATALLRQSSAATPTKHRRKGIV